MKFWHILRFEFLYQFRRVPAWLFFAILAVIAGMQVRMNFLADALYDEFYVNSPFVIAVVSVFGTLMWLLAAAPVAGEAASRDLHTGMYPMTYTTPVRKAEYLFGRFAAAFLLNVWIMSGIPVGITAAVYLPGTDAVVIGPFRPEAYITAFAYIALPNAFLATAVQFCFAVLFRRSKAAYLGSLVIFFASYALSIMVAMVLGRPDLARLVDPIGIISIVSDLSSNWTPIEKGSRLLKLEGPFLSNRLLWTGIALVTLLLTCFRFRFAHFIPVGRRTRLFPGRKKIAESGEEVADQAIPLVRRSFGWKTRVHQTIRLTGATFRQLAGSRAGLLLLSVAAFLTFLVVPLQMNNMGVPLEPRTGYLITFLTAPVTSPLTVWVFVPLLIIFYAGEIVWREREARTNAITDTTPVSEWVFFLGKFLGLCLMLVLWTMLLTAAGVLVQVRLGLRDPETALLLRIMFGLQLPEYLLFALLVLVIHILVNHKAAGHLAALAAFGLISFGSRIGLEHNLLLFGNGPSWSFSDMKGFGGSIEPWLWFKLYWTAWAVMLALAGHLLWVRSADGDLRGRLLSARRRFSGSPRRLALAGLALIVGTGGFIWYNTNVLNTYQTTGERAAKRAEYERRYSRYAVIPQPVISGVKLQVGIFPQKHEMRVRGTYRLINRQAVPVDSVHITTVPGVHTRITGFNRPASADLSDDELGHHIYTLRQSLQPGDSLEVSFEVVAQRRGFSNRGGGTAVAANGTAIANEDWLPDIGYQSRRELTGAADRRAFGLPSRPAVPDLDLADARRIMAAQRRISFEAVIETDGDQTAIAPGSLKRTWTSKGRRYFHYIADVPIQNQYAIFSARYAMYQGVHHGVTIQIFHHPGHRLNIESMYRSVRASLDYHTRQYGPYPYKQIRLIEEAGKMMGMHAEATQITYGEGFSLMNPEADPDVLDLPFAVVAHETAHQWWGHQLKPAHVAGAPILAESLAWYSAMGVVEESAGPGQLNRLREMMRQPYPIKPVRPSVPLLKAVNAYQAYRKGPFAFYALSRYIGRDRVDTALRNLLHGHLEGDRLATTQDLYRELEKVVPSPERPLLNDLFQENIFWELKTEQVSATKLISGDYKVKLKVRAGKVRIDAAGKETPVPMNDPIEIGIYGGGKGKAAGTLYLKKHLIRSGTTEIELTVPGKPAVAGIDPNYLLIDEKPADNTREIKAWGQQVSRPPVPERPADSKR